MDHGDLEEGVAEYKVSECFFFFHMRVMLKDIPAVLEASQGVVPCQERGKEPKESRSLLEGDLSSMVAQVVSIVFASEQEEADIEEEEEKKEGQG